MIRALFVVPVLTILLFASPVLAQTELTGAAVAPGCGTEQTQFDVKAGKAQPAAQPDAGKALVYFIEDDSDFGSFPKPTTRMGVDGHWVGATHDNSYFYFSVEAGVHHLCANWQSSVLLRTARKTAAFHFTAEAGGVYYFEVKNAYWLDHGNGSMSLEPVDSDQGQLLVNEFAPSTFHQK